MVMDVVEAILLLYVGAEEVDFPQGTSITFYASSLALAELLFT